MFFPRTFFQDRDNFYTSIVSQTRNKHSPALSENRIWDRWRMRYPLRHGGGRCGDIAHSTKSSFFSNSELKTLTMGYFLTFCQILYVNLANLHAIPNSCARLG